MYCKCYTRSEALCIIVSTEVSQQARIWRICYVKERLTYLAKEVGIGLYKPEMHPWRNAPALLHSIGASLIWQLMTARRRGKSEAFRNSMESSSKGSVTGVTKVLTLLLPPSLFAYDYFNALCSRYLSSNRA